MRVRVTLRDPDETHLVDIDAYDRREFEAGGRRQIGLSAGPLQQAVQEKPDTSIARLCWHNLHRQGLVDGWPAYSPRHINHDVDPDGGELGAGGLPDPTRPGQSRG